VPHPADRLDAPGQPPVDAAQDESAPMLAVRDVADVAAEVDAAPAPSYVFRPVWPADAYGVLAAEDKAGKTWAVLDAAVACAAGTRWLGQFETDTPGPALLFLGEGGERRMVRRLRAVADHHAVQLESLPIRVCCRVPHLTDSAAIGAIRHELEAHPARLAVIDPLYLAARGAKGSDLYEMGSHLESVQRAAQDKGAALMLSHHWNKTGEGRGHQRMSGAGPGAWGRVLVSGSVDHLRTEADRSTVATLTWSFRGDELPELDATVRRTVRADDPDDLASPLRYHVEPVEPPPGDGPAAGLRPAHRRVYTALADAGEAMTVQAIGDAVADDGQGKPLKRRTIQDALKALRDAGLADGDSGLDGAEHHWVRSETTESTCAPVCAPPAEEPL
jgi:hypothetical protein